MDESVPHTQVSSFPMEIYFHPLFDTNGEDDAWRIKVIVPLSIISLSLAPTKCQHTFHFHTILRWIGRKISHLKAIILHDLGAAIPRRL